MKMGLETGMYVVAQLEINVILMGIQTYAYSKRIGLLKQIKKSLGPEQPRLYIPHLKLMNKHKQIMQIKKSTFILLTGKKSSITFPICSTPPTDKYCNVYRHFIEIIRGKS